MEKLEKLKPSDMEEAVTLFQNGLAMEIPQGKMEKNVIAEELSKTTCLVHRSNKGIDGLANFRHNRSNSITILFICTSKPGNGIGTTLMHKIASMAIAQKAPWIYSGVSSRDKRAMRFYHSLGFRPYRKTRRFGYYIKTRPKQILKRSTV